MYIYPQNKESIEYLLQQPFDETDIEWRIQQAGISNKYPWAMALAYVQARAIQNRLDQVFGFSNWKTEYAFHDHGIICRLSVFSTNLGEWIYKEDGSPETDIESFKGGISSAFKRVAASGYGIGRYLYSLDTTLVNCSTSKQQGWKKQYLPKEKMTIYWETPKLPNWALPGGST